MRNLRRFLAWFIVLLVVSFAVSFSKPEPIPTPGPNPPVGQKHYMVSNPQQQVDMVHNVQQRVWINLPKGYEEKVREFIDYSKIFKNKHAREFLENFMVREMKKDWWISKENQLLFIYYSVFLYTVNKDIYDWEDGNEERIEEFEYAVEEIDSCWERYINEFKEYLDNVYDESKQKIAEYDKMILEAKQKIAENKQQSVELRQKTIESLNNALYAISDFYTYYKIYPDSERLNWFKPIVKEIIPLCKKYSVDYKAFFLGNLWDDNNVNELLHLFEIE